MLLWLQNLHGAGGGDVQYPEANSTYPTAGGWLDPDLYAWKQRRLQEEEDKRKDEIALLEAEIATVEPVTAVKQATISDVDAKAARAIQIEARLAEIRAEALRVVELELEAIQRDDEEVLLAILMAL